MRVASDLVWAGTLVLLFVALLGYNSWYVGTFGIEDATEEETRQAGQQFRVLTLTAVWLALIGVLLRVW